jgi:predicted metal-dependent hydrolase
MSTEIFAYGKYRCEYQLAHEPRKTVRLSVRPDQSVVLRCPAGARPEQIDKFLRRKWAWISKQQRYFRQYCHRAAPREHVSGESYLYLGRQYQLIVRKSKHEAVVMGRGKIVVNANDDGMIGKRVERLLGGWYRERCAVVFGERLAEVAASFGLPAAPRLLIKKMAKRWGSFVRGEAIILNPRLILASKDCIDYVITHELCHFKHRRHDRRFFDLLGKKLPGWEKTKEKLELRLGAEAEINI